MKLVFATLFPEHLDLNGDLANVKVLAKRAALRGAEVEFVSINKGQDLPSRVDFLILGHGSNAAWSDLATDLARLAPQLGRYISEGGIYLAVASGFAKSIELGLAVGNLKPSKRISKFEIAKLGKLEVIGYRNSANSLPIIERQGSALLTQLHGPLFAKNPKLADDLLNEILQKSQLELPEGFVTEKAGQEADFIEAMVADAWRLEKDLARE